MAKLRQKILAAWEPKIKKLRRSKSDPTHAGSGLEALLTAMGGNPVRSRLAALWENWEKALGAELAALAPPAGSKNRVLLIYAEDAMQMQEQVYISEEILAAVNSYLQCEYFEEVRSSILETPAQKAEVKNKPEETPANLEKRGCPLHGKFLANMDPDSPVARCYAQFLKLYGK